LIEKYGTPVIDERLRYSSLADYTDDAGALKLGYLGFRAQWITDTTEILIGLINNNRNIGITIGYTSLYIDIPSDLSDF